MMFINYVNTFSSSQMMSYMGGILPLIVLLAAWSLVWKGLALWHAARKKEYGWFVVLLLINTAGILEIIYLLGIRKISINALFTVDGK